MEYQTEQMNEQEQYHIMTLNREMDRLEKIGTRMEVPKGYEFNKPKTVPDFCYLVKEGRVMSYEILYSGDLRRYNYMVPGSLFLEDCLLLDKPCPITFQAITPVVAYQIDKCDLKRAFKHDIDVVMDVCVSMSDKFLGAMGQLRSEPVQPAEWKICRLLLTLAGYSGVKKNNGITISEKVRQRDIAELLGLNRITVTRKLKELEENGYIIKENGYITIPDVKRLTVHMRSLGSPDTF